MKYVLVKLDGTFCKDDEHEWTDTDRHIWECKKCGLNKLSDAAAEWLGVPNKKPVEPIKGN